MLERIISRGLAGPELAVLRAARVCGVMTGGNTRIHHGPKFAQLVQRFGLSTDGCSRRQALLHNVRLADGTLVVGPARADALRGSERDGKPLFHAAMVLDGTARCVADWADRFEVRTLNVVGAADAAWGSRAGGLMLELLQAAGRVPSRPNPARTQVVSAGKRFYAVALWPRQRAWMWDEAAARWRPFRPGPDFGALLAGAQPWTRLWQLLPTRVRPWVYRGPGIDLELLAALAAFGKPAEDLARAGQWGVLRLIANARTLLPKRMARRNALRRLLRRPQRDVIAAFGFPATGSAVRALAKVPSGSASLGTVRRLRDLLRDDRAARSLRHVPQISRTVVEVLADPWLRGVIGPAFLRDVATFDDNAFGPSLPGDLLSDIHALRTHADRTGRHDRVAVVRSVKALYERLAALEALPDRCWPRPSLVPPGVPGLIEPLTTAAALVEEGRAMRHCVRRCADAVMDGRSLIFRVVGDDRLGVDQATVELRPGADGQWHLAQLAGVRNAPVSAATARLVEAWLRRAHADPLARPEQIEAACRAALAVVTAGGA